MDGVDVCVGGRDAGLVWNTNQLGSRRHNRDTT